jgi:hypothetical protein
MSDSVAPLWEHAETVEARADPAFAYHYWTSLQAAASDPGVEKIEIDGPFRAGARGVTHTPGGQIVEWVVSHAEPNDRAAIDIPLADATLRSEWRFTARPGGGSLLTQRMSLFGPSAEAYRKDVAAGFGPPNMRDGMLAMSKRLDEAAGLK